MVPTFKKMIQVYKASVRVEQLRCGKPGKGTVRNTITGVRHFTKWVVEHEESLKGMINRHRPICPDPEDMNPLLVSIVTPKIIRRYLSDMLTDGVLPISAMSYVSQLRQLFARWARPYYEDHNWKIPQFPSFGSRPVAPRYRRPQQQQLTKVKEWYLSLTAEITKHSSTPNAPHSPRYVLWFVTTMMLEFGMRNGDILRLKKENFIVTEKRCYLSYKPHKTAHSSGRTVRWPIHATIWEMLQPALQHDFDETFTIDEDIFVELNQIMRSLGFTGTKGAYELRKICIDHIYQNFGAERAVSISGDDIRTIIHYYADPSQPNVDDIRVTDLL